MICPSCGEFILADNPKVCPFCHVDLEHFAYPEARSYGASRAGSPYAPESEVPPAGGQVTDVAGLQFASSSSLQDSGPRKFIEKRLPRCPFCRSKDPDWEYAEVTGWLKRANFRCKKCQGIVSAPLDSITSWKKPTKMFGNLGSSGYFRVESVGNSPGMQGTAAKLVGGEFSMERLRIWADRPSEELPVSAS